MISVDDTGACKDGIAGFSYQCINGNGMLNCLSSTDLEKLPVWNTPWLKQCMREVVSIKRQNPVTNLIVSTALYTSQVWNLHQMVQEGHIERAESADCYTTTDFTAFPRVEYKHISKDLSCFASR